MSFHDDTSFSSDGNIFCSYYYLLTVAKENDGWLLFCFVFNPDCFKVND